MRQLQRAGFDLKKLSIVGKDYHTEEDVVGYYNTGDRMKRWGSAAPSGVASGACCSAPRFSRYRVLGLCW